MKSSRVGWASLAAVLLVALGVEAAKHSFKNNEKIILWANKGSFSCLTFLLLKTEI